MIRAELERAGPRGPREPHDGCGKKATAVSPGRPGYGRCAAPLVRPRAARSALARAGWAPARPLCGLALGDHAATDHGRRGDPVLRTLPCALADGGGAS